jgi:hypothetical protein
MGKAMPSRIQISFFMRRFQIGAGRMGLKAAYRKQLED